MVASAHAGQLASAVGTLEALADIAEEQEAGTLSAAADVCRSYASSKEIDFEPDDPGPVEPSDLRVASVFLTGRVKHAATPDQRRVLQRAMQYLDERVQRHEDQ